jgi:hypothetical protein
MTSTSGLKYKIGIVLRDDEGLTHWAPFPSGDKDTADQALLDHTHLVGCYRWVACSEQRYISWSRGAAISTLFNDVTCLMCVHVTELHQ